MATADAAVPPGFSDVTTVTSKAVVGENNMMNVP